MSYQNSRVILAIDPGNEYSGYVVLIVHEDKSIYVVDKGKVQNTHIFHVMDKYMKNSCEIAIEMIASYGMAVGKEVFETCVWIGKFIRHAEIVGITPTRIYRLQEKMCLCHSTKAKDSNIVQALVDRFAPCQPNMGKGTKKNPGFFFGFKKDIWQAMAVAVTYLELEG